MTTQQIIELIVPLIQSIVWSALVAGLLWLYHKLKAALPQNQQALLDRIVQHAVQFVMQRFGNLSPEEKRKEAEKAIYALADFFKYKGLDPVIVNTILESIVWETKQALEPAIIAPDTPKPAS